MKLEIFIDGACRGNPGPGACAMVVIQDGKIIVQKNKKLEQRITNNIAEWEALSRTLQWLSAYLKNHSEIKEVVINSDSELVVNQFNRRYKINQGHLLKYAQEAWIFTEGLPVKVKVSWIPRAQNAVADRLANAAFN